MFFCFFFDRYIRRAMARVDPTADRQGYAPFARRTRGAIAQIQELHRPWTFKSH